MLVALRGIIRRRWQETGLRILVVLAVGSVLGVAVASPQSSSLQRTTSQKPKIDPQLQEAEELFQQGSPEEAKKKVQEELQRNPSSIAAYNLLGIICTSQKDYSNALEAFQKALKLDPNSARTRNNLGNLYVTEGMLDEAEKQFREVLRASPANTDANYNLGLVLLAKNLPVEAITHFQRVHPQNVETRFNLTRAYLRAGRTSEGLKEAATLSAEKEQDVQLHFTLGVLLLSEKQFKATEGELEKASALQPESFEILYNLASAGLQAGDYGKAELVLNRALKLKPDSVETMALLSQVYSQQSRSVDALDLLVRAHKLAPDNTDVIFLLARASMTQNYFEDAIPLLESGVKLAPKRSDLRAALGESYFMSGKSEKAIEAFKDLIEIDPSARSYAFMGLSYRHLGRFDEARKYFEEGLKKDRRNTSCLFNLGFIEERQGNHQKAEQLFQEALRSNPAFPDALLELANLRIANKRFEEAAVLLRKYVSISRSPASGYYKLAMVERSLHQDEAAQRDLNVFRSMSKDAAPGPYPFQNLFDYVDNRSNLTPAARAQLDLNQLIEETTKHPDQPQNLYLLAEAYLKAGNSADARKTIAQLDQISGSDYRTQTGVGVLLARHRLYDDAIQHFQNALHADPSSDDVKFDLADAWFRKGAYAQALEAAQQVSEQGQKDDAFLALLGDIYAHLGDSARATEIFRSAINRNPDSDQSYLSLALVELRRNNTRDAEEILQKGLNRMSSSGKLLWGLGITSALEGKTAEAAGRLERSVDLLPEWPGSYSVLGVFYYQTGQIAKAREVLNRFKGSNAGGLDVSRIEEALSKTPETTPKSDEPMPTMARQQLLQFALSVADRTL